MRSGYFMKNASIVLNTQNCCTKIQLTLQQQKYLHARIPRAQGSTHVLAINAYRPTATSLAQNKGKLRARRFIMRFSRSRQANHQQAGETIPYGLGDPRATVLARPAPFFLSVCISSFSHPSISPEPHCAPPL